MPAFNTIDEILEQMRQGKMAVIMDDEDRENEGDLVMAAACVRAEDVNFMARYGRGLICLTLPRDRCRTTAKRTSSTPPAIYRRSSAACPSSAMAAVIPC